MTSIRNANTNGRNNEGYCDYTASRALDNVEKELRAMGNWRREPKPEKPVKYRLTWKPAA